jgi:hypothetical protein
MTMNTVPSSLAGNGLNPARARWPKSADKVIGQCLAVVCMILLSLPLQPLQAFGPLAGTYATDFIEEFVEDYDDYEEGYQEYDLGERHDGRHGQGRYGSYQAPREYRPFAPEQRSYRGGTLAQYGPFRVVSPYRVDLIGGVDSYTPNAFRRMRADWPELRALHIIECGGTVDDNANLALARMIRRAGIATHVPSNGSARSGAIELFLAGVRRTADRGAEFIVHSWRNGRGLEPSDYSENHPVHRPYLSFYQEVGMSPRAARAFYRLTNSVPHHERRRLTLRELASFNLLD